MDDSSGPTEGRNVGGVNMPFMLSGIIKAHNGDIKGISETSSGLIVTGSRDGSVKAFQQREGDYSEVISIKQPSNLAVNALAVFETDNGWLLFAGRKDGSIGVFASDRTEPLRTLHKHELNVCVLRVDPVNKVLISGSWDGKAIVWPISDMTDNKQFNALGLVDHKMSVWAVASITDMPGFYLTGSADMTIKFWEGDSVLRTFSGHRDVVRCIEVISSERFLSASNDSTIRLWDLVNNCCVRSYSSHPCEYIYNMSSFCIDGGSMIANCGESGFLELWRIESGDKLCHSQLISTPAQSIWCLSTLRNGDIAVGADDGNVYVFTRDIKRKATSEQVELFEAGTAKRRAKAEAIQANQEVVKITVEAENGESKMVLSYKKGTDPADAARAFVLENNLSPAYIDEIVGYIKENIPEARLAAERAAVSGSMRNDFEDGKQWDYTFNVETEDGRTLKLHYNVGEDTNWAAQRFVEKYNLPVSFLPKVSALLQAQVPGSSTASENSSSFVDPFTGESRYVPGMGSASASSVAADPLTGEGRYVLSTANDGVLLPNASIPQDKTRPRGELVPMREYFRFGIEQASSKAIAKLNEFNELQCDLRLSEQQLEALAEVLSHATFEVRDVHISALNTGLQWSIDTILPIVDAFRLALLNRQLNKIYCSMRSEEGKEPRGTLTLEKLTALLIGSTPDNVRVLACRAIANAAVYEWGRQMLLDDLSTNVSALISQLSSPKPPLQLAAASALANWALLLLKHTESGEMSELGPREDMIMLIIKSLEGIESFSDYAETTKVRLLQTVVTLMWGDSGIIKLAKSRNIATIVNKMKDAVVDEAGKSIARDIVEMTFAV